MPQTVDPGPYASHDRPAWLDVDWARHHRTIEIEGRRVAYVDAGEGPPLILVHGHSGRWQNWLEQIPHFMRTHRVIAPDLPGFGDSEMPRDDLTIVNYGRIVDRLCDALGIERAVMVGNSMGGGVSAEVAIKFGTRVEGLVLVSATGLAGRYLGIPNELARNPAFAAAGRVVLSLTGAPAPVLKALEARPRGRALTLAGVVRYPGRLYPGMAFELARGAGKPGAAPASLELATYDFRDEVPKIEAPTLIVWGARDRTVPSEGAGLYEELIRGSRALVYADTGHLPMVERPQRFNADLEAFLAEIDRRTDAGVAVASGTS
jgi:pimeloyl-ACP methyl ester carboxylesterase